MELTPEQQFGKSLRLQYTQYEKTRTRLWHKSFEDDMK